MFGWKSKSTKRYEVLEKKIDLIYETLYQIDNNFNTRFDIDIKKVLDEKESVINSEIEEKQSLIVKTIIDCKDFINNCLNEHRNTIISNDSEIMKQNETIITNQKDILTLQNEIAENTYGKIEEINTNLNDLKIQIIKEFETKVKSCSDNCQNYVNALTTNAVKKTKEAIHELETGVNTSFMETLKTLTSITEESLSLRKAFEEYYCKIDSLIKTSARCNDKNTEKLISDLYSDNHGNFKEMIEMAERNTKMINGKISHLDELIKQSNNSTKDSFGKIKIDLDGIKDSVISASELIRMLLLTSILNEVPDEK